MYDPRKLKRMGTRWVRLHMPATTHAWAEWSASSPTAFLWNDGPSGWRFATRGAIPLDTSTGWPHIPPHLIHDLPLGPLSPDLIALAPTLCFARPFFTSHHPEPLQHPLAWLPEICLWNAPGHPPILSLLFPIDAKPPSLDTIPSSTSPQPPQNLPPTPLSHAFEQWCHNVENARDACRDGRLEKVVLARSEHILAPPHQRFDIPATLDALRASHPDCTTFALRWPGVPRCFAGATPETLLRTTQHHLTTAALAGTWPRQRADALGHPTALQHMLRDPKLQHEHQVVVQSLLHHLAAFANNPSAAPTHLRALSHVVHLQTPIHATLRPEHTLLDVVEALHPTPAVGGLPRDAALHWIQQHEPLQRAWYAAPLGWHNLAGDGHAVVALRSAWIDATSVEAFAGAGITAGSDPIDEWRETEHKLQAFFSALRLHPHTAPLTLEEAP